MSFSEYCFSVERTLILRISTDGLLYTLLLIGAIRTLAKF
jgi:hypothetical protein